MAANEARVSHVNSVAEKLIGEGHPEVELIETRTQVKHFFFKNPCYYFTYPCCVSKGLNEAWERLKKLAAERQEKLAGSHEVQKFNRYAHTK